MTTFPAAKLHEYLSSCSIVLAASARSKTLTLLLWARIGHSPSRSQTTAYGKPVPQQRNGALVSLERPRRVPVFLR